MGNGNKTVLALLITVVILIAVFSGFGVSLFAGGTPQVVLPTAQPTESDDPQGGKQTADGAMRVEVTRQTVQNVIETLTRPESYYREVTLSTYWGQEGQSTVTAQVWVDGGFTRIDTALTGGTVEHTIVGAGKRYRWYNNERDYFTTDAGEKDADLMQKIPTYEDILALDTDSITATGYETRGGLACVYVEVAEDELGYRERYWVSVEQGLLVSAETEKEEKVVLRMDAYSVEIPVRSGVSFTLPDGTALHEVKG